MGVKKRVGLALGSGAARGLAHIGVLEVLEKEAIPIDVIAGTSMGAVIGALYAQGKRASEIRTLITELSSRRLVYWMDPALPKTGFIRGRRVEDALKSLLNDVKFRDLKIPFACVATDIETGEEIVINRGSVSEAIRTSISLPVILTTVKRGKRYLVDGGLVNPIPVSVVKQMKADFIIAVNVLYDQANRPKKARTRVSKEPNIIHIVMQSMYIGTYSLVKSSLSGADILIRPSVEHLGIFDFHHVREFIREGELAAREAIPEIKRKLGL